MKKPQQTLQTLHPFAQSKPSKALSDEDHFMREHGGTASRGLYLGIRAISFCLDAIFSAPLLLLLKLINYDHPLEKKRRLTDLKALSKAPIGARHRKAILKRSNHANTCNHSKSTHKRRA